MSGRKLSKKVSNDEGRSTPWTDTSRNTTSLRIPKIKEKPIRFENPDVLNLIHGQTKIPHRKSLDRLKDSYLNDPFVDSPLLSFHLSGAKKRRQYELIEKRARLTKIQTFKECQKETVEKCEPMDIQYFHKIMLKSAANVPTEPISEEWLDSIRNRLQGLNVKFPKICNVLIDEIKQLFMKTMTSFSTSYSIKSLSMSDESIDITSPGVALRRTSRYSLYLKRRNYLKRHLHILHPIQVAIFCRGVISLPTLLADMARYREMGFINLNDLVNLVSSDIKNSEHAVVTKYYMQVVSLVDKKFALKTVPEKLRPEFLESATNVFRVQVLNLIHRSIDNLLWMIDNELNMPYLILELSCNDNEICLVPNRIEIENCFHDMLNEMANIGPSLLSLHTWVDGVSGENQNIKITVNDLFLKEAHTKVATNLNRILESLICYVNDLKTQHSFLYTQAVFQDLDNFMATNPTFDDLIEKRNSFEVYMDDLRKIVENEYFLLGKLNQSNLIKSLNKLASEYCDKILNYLIDIHTKQNLSICQKFEELKRKALKEPESTEDLMQSGVYMLWASTNYVFELEKNIEDQLKKMINLLELTEVPINSISLMSRTISWLEDIKPVFEQNSSQYEQHKFELEERLQKRIETLHKDIDELEPKLDVLNDMDNPKEIQYYLEEMDKFIRILKGLDKDVEWINNEESLFKFPLSTYPDLDELKAFVDPFAKLLMLTCRWQWKRRVWMNGSFQNLNAQVVESSTDDFYKDFTITLKTYKSKIKQQIQESVTRRFKGNVDDPDPNNLPTPIKICNKMLEELKNFKNYIPLVRILCNPALMQRHWDEMSVICKFDVTPDFGTTLRKMGDKNLAPFLDQFEIISIGATKELQLGQNLRKMCSEWEGVVFPLCQWKETSLHILCELDDIQALLDDHLVKTLTMRGSAFVRPFEEEVKNWYLLLNRVNKTKECWEKIQVQWLYLMPIFSSKDITSQMVEENRLFRNVDNFYQRLIDGVKKDPRVLETAGTVGLLESFIEQLESLDKINNGVNEYLEKKRLFFPRFFFLSNDEMLEILSETKDPYRVQPHLKKCFEGINRLKFDGNLNIRSMISSEGELIPFVSQVDVKSAGGSVEKWLVQVEEQMIISVHDVLRKAHNAYVKTPRNNWIQTWPGQIVLCVSSIYWTLLVHRELKKSDPSAMETFHQSLNQQLNSTVSLVRGQLTTLARLTLGALVVVDVHARDVVEELFIAKVKSDQDFTWLAQLRYYWQSDECLVRMINATIKYAYEYLGNTPRLVITPLTDRCYRTLIGAYSLHLNGAPEGPAGTGKTETTKDLAKALAVQCIVFNCSDGLDFIAMGKFFKGLASSGAWACFDEFNRIELEVLSVIAQQILSISRAIQMKLETFIFEGVEIKLNPACYVCITMNPGYAGRSELPDNLKVLFRTVAMMVPDYALIAEISLYSFGFINARELSIKIVTTYVLCYEQLSTQSHYDYGMRAVKTVLTAAGNLKLNFPDMDENVLLLRAIIDVNRSKLLDQDLPLFDGIISDLFPGVITMRPDYGLLLKAVDSVCLKKNLQSVEYFQKKLIETYEMMKVRHGFMLVGEPFSGKTTVLHVLAEALTLLTDPTIFQQINPKSITMDQLYGNFDPVSYEWSDGVLAIAFRNFVRGEKGVRKWIIFDGPVDAVWIENLNTVLDDNKKLCLTSGEVIAMTSEMSLIFEVMDLKQASPATVSRCGMIYMEPAALGWQVLVRSWLNTQDPVWIEGNTEIVWDLLMWLIPCSLVFIRKKCSVLVEGGDSNRVQAMLTIIEMLMTDACKTEPFFVNIWIQAAFMFAGVWGLAGAVDNPSRVLFNDFYLGLWKGTDENYPIPESLAKVEISIPSEGILHDYIYNFRGKGNWKYLPEVLRMEKVDESVNLTQMLVPTVITLKYQYIIDLHVRHKRPLLLIGGTGTGKSFMTQNILMNQIDQDVYLPSFLTFTTATSANQAQKLVISKLNKLRRGIFGPPKGKQSIIFIDDLNMPAKDTYGTQPAIELLRQNLDCGIWYDLKDSSVIKLNNVQFLTAMGLPGGSRQEVTLRLLRHFNIFSINDLSQESMTRIFTTLLLNGLKRNGFASDVIASVNNLVNATSSIYLSSLSELRPTPAKSHYIFNLRDFSRVIMGCALVKKDSIESRKGFARLWVHEALRVFYDRLIEDIDREWMFQKIRQCVIDDLKEDFDHLQYDGMPTTEESLRDLMFGNYLDPDALEEDRKYEELSNVNQLLEIAKATMEDYNTSHKRKINIVFFRYALEHLNRVCRILALPQGSGLLVGISGSGRQSLCQLATAMLGYNFFQPEITTSYSLSEWRNDLKKILKESGGRGKNTTFLLSEGQIKEESFLADVDALLNLGEVPELFPIDEKQEILELVRLAAQGGNRNLDISPLAVFNFFINRCKLKLHMLICFSPVGSNFRNRLRLYPSLVNCCTIDWFEDWPPEALQMVAVDCLKGVNNLPENVKSSTVVACQYYHTSARTLSADFFSKTSRKTYITSSAFLGLILSFTRLVNKTQEDIMASKMRYVGGLDKLNFASEQVAAMQRELSELKPKLVIAAQETMTMMQVIESEKKKVESIASLVKEDEKIANIQAAAAADLKAECEADLAQAIPILEDAIAALNTLKPSDITLVKSMKNPPDNVKLVMAAVCVMKNIQPDRLPDPATGRKILDYWGPSKRILGDMNFLPSLKEYDKDNIHPEIMIKIRRDYLPLKDFKPEVVAKASSAAEGLCKWVIAMDLYDAVAKEVAPKKLKLETAEKAFAETMVLLNAKREMVEQLEAQLAELMQTLRDTQERKQKLEEDVNLCENKLVRAEKLINGLGGEKSRWLAAAEELQRNYDAIAGDILLSCSVISYLSPFTLPYRTKTILEWHNFCKKMNIPCSEVYLFSKILGSEVTIQQWNLFGLPSDQFSIDNAIILHNSEQWPLLVDPQGQANKWIKAMEKANNIEVVKLSTKNYMKIIEYCIEYGKPVLIENVLETLDAALDPILSRNVFIQAGKKFISLWDDVIEYNDNFKLYLTTNLRNPHYVPEIFNKVRVINFALTLEGLEDQLLGIVVAKERPDLQAKRQGLIARSAKNKKALLDVEELILQTLSGSKGNILEDETAIETLDSSKLLSESIKNEQATTKETERVIESFRLSYRPIAIHSSIMYYCIANLTSVDPMYQFSLTWYINLFISSIDSANKSKILEKRLQFLHDTFTYDLYTNVCRSIFEKDKLLFSLILCCAILIYKGKIDRNEYQFFITGGVGLISGSPNPAQDWLADKSWSELERLSSFQAFEGVVEHFRNNLGTWKKFYDLADPTYEDIPQTKQLNSFEKLILIRIFRPDRVLPNIFNFVVSEMGEKFVRPPLFDIGISYGESNCFCPLIFILSPGSDPMAGLLAYAEKMGFGDKFASISLGQGQGPVAEKLIEEAQKEGNWVCLQNCHLAASWMQKLEDICESMDSTNTVMEFRLWLTSYPSDVFPSRVLQNGVKMTNEAPQGLKSNILRSFQSDPVNNKGFFEGIPGKNAIFGKLLYGMAFFHAVIQERRKFGPIGWNIPYGFDESDFQISIKQLFAFIRDYAQTPYDAVRYLAGECNYGGRVTDNWDRRTLNTLLSDFINPDVVNKTNYFFAPLGPVYGLPRKVSYNEYLIHIEKLPQAPPPEVFGLHNNAGIVQGQQYTKKLFDNAIGMEGSGSGVGAISDNALLEIAQDILNNLPKLFDLENAMLKYPVTYSESMNALLIQELERFNVLLSIIKRSLNVLTKAIQGFVVITPDVEALANSIKINQIPLIWMKASYPSLKNLGSYISNLRERVAMYDKWLVEGIPNKFWISGFYSIHGFLTGVRQNYARKYKIPIDKLTFDFQVIPDDAVKPEDGAHVFGLFIEGARWDTNLGYLVEQRSKVLFDPLPHLWLIPIEKRQLIDKGRYLCPLYKTSERKGTLSTTGISTNFVLPILLESNVGSSHWIKRGVALLCQLVN